MAANFAIVLGMIGPGRAAQVASPGRPKKPENKARRTITYAFQTTRYHSYFRILNKSAVNSRTCVIPKLLYSILPINFQLHIFNYPFSSESRILTLILPRSSRSGNILRQDLGISQSSTLYRPSLFSCAGPWRRY